MSPRLRAATALAAVLCLVPRLAHSQIPNAGFESWAGGDPVGWVTSNIPPVLVNVTQTSVAHSGASALRGDVMSFFTFLAQPLIQSGPLGRGFPFNQRSAQFTGFYQFNPVGGDRFAVNVILYNGGMNGTPVAVAAAALPSPVTSYASFSVPFSYLSPLTPDTCIVQIQIVGPTGSDYHAGSYFLLDDIALSGNVGVEDGPRAPLEISLSQNFPNPFDASTTLRYELARRSDVTLAVYDMQGREVATLERGTQEPGTHTAVWDSRKQPTGIYYCRLTTGSFAATRKLVLMR